MAQWSTYLAFDIMSRVSFGKDFEMLSKPDVRDVPKLIESAGLNQLMVRFRSKCVTRDPLLTFLDRLARASSFLNGGWTGYLHLRKSPAVPNC